MDLHLLLLNLDVIINQHCLHICIACRSHLCAVTKLLMWFEFLFAMNYGDSVFWITKLCFSMHIIYTCLYIYIVDITVKTCMHTVKRKLSFQQAICYQSFRWVNILYAWTVKSVNRMFKNSKHMTAITSPSKPGHLQLVKNALSASQNWNATLPTCLWCGWENVRLGLKWDCQNVFLDS